MPRSDIMTSGIFLSESNDHASKPLFTTVTSYLLRMIVSRSQHKGLSSSTTNTFFMVLKLPNYQSKIKIMCFMDLIRSGRIYKAN